MTAARKQEPIPFGKYRLIERLYVGGTSEVWRATAPGFGGPNSVLAIKRVLPHLGEDAQFIDVFVGEAQLAVRLNHPNLAQHIEIGRVEGTCFIAMEYVSGPDLSRVITQRRRTGVPAPISLGCYVVAQCCLGVEYAHAKTDENGRGLGIVHREVAPHNVLLSYDGHVKVTGWTGGAAFGARRNFRSQFAYLSPEQIRGQRIDRRSDVFQLGICLYELLTGVRVFACDSDLATLEKARDAVVEPPTHHNREIPEALEQVVLRALAKDVDARYSHASDLGDALEQFSGDRAELSQFLRTTFAEDCERERQRMLALPNLPASEEARDGVAELLEQLERKWDA